MAESTTTNKKSDKDDFIGSNVLEGQLDALEELQEGYTSAVKSFANAFIEGVDEYASRAKDSGKEEDGRAVIKDMPKNQVYGMLKCFRTMADSMVEVAEVNARAMKKLVDRIEN
jgi:hypothetical protein